MGTPRAAVLVLLAALCAGCGRADEYPPLDPVPTVLGDPPPPLLFRRATASDATPAATDPPPPTGALSSAPDTASSKAPLSEAPAAK